MYMRSSFNDCGAGSLLIADVMDESAQRLSARMRCPKNLINFFINSYFSEFKVMQNVCSHFRVVKSPALSLI